MAKDPINLIVSALTDQAMLIVPLLEKCCICASPATIKFQNPELTSGAYCDRCAAKAVVDARKRIDCGKADWREAQLSNPEMWVDMPTAKSTRFIVEYVSLVAGSDVIVH